jgi:hypothetical protein
MRGKLAVRASREILLRVLGADRGLAKDVMTQIIKLELATA